MESTVKDANDEHSTDKPKEDDEEISEEVVEAAKKRLGRV